MWYKVEDKLPNEFQFVLVFTKQGKYGICSRVGGKWINMHLNGEDIVAWTEFPKPPIGHKIQAKKIGNNERYLIKK